MCKLIVGAKRNNDDLELVKNILLAQRDTLFSQPDGFGALIIKNDGTLETKRELIKIRYPDVFNFVLDQIENIKFFGLHSRIKTVGETDMANVHFFEDGGYYFAHNGHVSEYGTYRNSESTFKPGSVWSTTEARYIDREEMDLKERIRQSEDYHKVAMESLSCQGCKTTNKEYCRRCDKKVRAITTKIARQMYNEKKPEEKKIENKDNAMSDSYQFLKSMDKSKLDEKYLEKHMFDKLFNGIGVIVGEAKKDVYLISRTREMMAMANENFNIFFSYDPETTLKVTKRYQVMGVPLYSDTEDEELPINVLKGYIGAFKLMLP